MANRFVANHPHSPWKYQPDKIAPLIFAAAFLASGAWHAWQSRGYSSWKVTGLLPVGALLMVCGFATREICAFYVNSIPLYIVSIVFLLLGPCVSTISRENERKTDDVMHRPIWAAANYFTLARMLYYIPWLAPLHPGRILSTFIAMDLLVELLTGNAAPKVANRDSSKTEREIGEYIIKVSLIMQAGLFAAYVLILGIWHARVSKRGLVSDKLRPLILAMYASSALITGRCIFRVVEYFGGPEGPAMTHEWPFWVFEAVLMLLNSILLNVIHPALHLPRDNRVFLAMDGKTEVMGPGWAQSRKWYWHFLDPFHFRSCCGRNKQEDYWKLDTQEHFPLNSMSGPALPKSVSRSSNQFSA